MDPKRKKQKSDRRAARHVARAWEAVEAGDLNIAVREIRRAVSERENNPAVWNDCGLIFSLAEKKREAEQAFRNAILLAPTYPDAYVHLARLLAERGRTIQATRYQRRAVELKPDIQHYRERLAEYESQVERDAPDE